jgi:hypothetical protein
MENYKHTSGYSRARTRPTADTRPIALFAEHATAAD